MTTQEPMDVNSPEAALWSENMRLKSENEWLRSLLKPFAQVGARFAPHTGSHRAWPPEASAGRMNLDPLKVRDFVEASRALGAGEAPRQEEKG